MKRLHQKNSATCRHNSKSYRESPTAISTSKTVRGEESSSLVTAKTLNACVNKPVPQTLRCSTSLTDIKNIVDRLVSVTDLSRGKATKVINDVKRTKEPYIILKNSKPVAAVIDIEQLTEILKIQEEHIMLQLAEERMKNHDPSKTLTHEQVLERYGITEAEVSGAMDSVEIE